MTANPNYGTIRVARTASGVQIIQIQDYEEKTNITLIKSCSTAEYVYSVEKNSMWYVNAPALQGILGLRRHHIAEPGAFNLSELKILKVKLYEKYFYSY